MIQLEQPSVGALEQADARVVAQLHVDLAEAGVDGRDVRGAMLQKAVGKSSGRCANIEAGAAGNVDLPVIQRSGQLQSAPADVGKVIAEEPDGGVNRDGCAGLVDLLLAHQNPPGKDQRSSALTAGGEATLDEHLVETHLFWALQGQAIFRNARFSILHHQRNSLPMRRRAVPARREWPFR